MKKYFINLGLGIAAMLCLSFSSNAEVLPLDGADLVLGNTYQVTADYMFKDVKCQFTAPADMRLAMKFIDNDGCDVLWPFTTANYEPTSQLQDPIFKNNLPASNINYLVCEKGKTYYFKCDCMMSGRRWSVTIYDADNAAPEIRFIEPNNNTTVSISRYKFVDFVFTDAVAVGGATISCGSNVAHVSPIQIDMNATARVEFAGVLMEWYNENKIKKGDVMEIKLTGVCSEAKAENVVNGNGEVSVKYPIMGKPVSMIGTHNASFAGELSFLSYYLPDDERGVVTFTFDGPLMPYSDMIKGRDRYSMPFQLHFGSYEEKERYDEVLTPIIDAEKNTITLDFRNKLRTYKTMHLELQEWTDMDILLQNLQSADGQYIFNESTASIGSFGYRYTYLPVVNSDLASDFVVYESVESDSEITGKLSKGNKLAIYVDGYKNIRLNGFTLESGDVKVNVPMSEISLVEEPGTTSAINYVFVVPDMEGVENEAEVKVYPTDLLCSDGMDHLELLTKTFKWSKSTGIESIDAEQGVFDIYSIDGRVVSRGANGLKGLSKGLYIANGKKVLVK